jgi:hypothetical protein
MRAVAVLSAVPWFVGAVLLLGAVWVCVRLWGPAESLIMDVSRGQGPGTPAAITRTEYGYFGYMSSGSAIYVDRAGGATGHSELERVETKRAIHWIGLLKTVGGTALLVLAVFGLPRWMHRMFTTVTQPSGVPPNNRWRGP